MGSTYDADVGGGDFVANLGAPCPTAGRHRSQIA